MSRIVPLSEEVISRIAAGEVIQRPSNALKEILENSIDAESTKIAVILGKGGYKLLQCTDNGKGIARDDFELLCTRFATSKISKYSDLDSISTFGFRGEALASISQIAHVSVVTRTLGDSCAYKVEYLNGKIAGEIKTSAGNFGTVLRIENMFYNAPIRQKMGNSTEEYNRSLDVLTKYALHFSGISISCKKADSATADLRTLSNVSKLDNIASLYGRSISKEVLEFSTENAVLGIKFSGFLTNANFRSKKLTLILFVNNRLVQFAGFRTVIDAVYSSILPKHTHPFVYLALEIDPKLVDVNVHPTKNEVFMLNSEEICAFLESELVKVLSTANTSRTFLTQTVLSERGTLVNGIENEENREKREKIAPNRMNRMDVSNPKNRLRAYMKQPQLETLSPVVCMDSTDEIVAEPRYDSIKDLIAAIEHNSSEELVEIFRKAVFVGNVSTRLLLIQYELKLFLCDLCAISKAFFYEMFLRNFSEFSSIELSEGMCVGELIRLGLESEEIDVEPDKTSELTESLAEVLVSHSEMLEEYFKIDLRNGMLTSLPVAVHGYTPPLYRLPFFLIRLACEVDFTAERECFRDICEELSEFYQVHPEEYYMAGSLSEGLEWTIQHVLLEKMRFMFSPPVELVKEGSVVQVACVESLYKVFERC